MEIAEQDAVMSNILSNACAGEWAWPKGLAVLQNERLRGGGRSLPGFSAVMQSLQWLTAVALDLLKFLERANFPPSSHALAAVLGEVAEVPEVEVMAFSMLARATVDGGSSCPSQFAADSTVCFVGRSCLPASGHGGSPTALYQHQQQTGSLPLHQGAAFVAAPPALCPRPLRWRSVVCQAIESFGAGTKRLLKVAGTQKAKVLEAVVAGGVQRPTQILEIGTYCGYSALRMLLALQRSVPPPLLHIDSLEADAVHAAVACNVLQVADCGPGRRSELGSNPDSHWTQQEFAAMLASCAVWCSLHGSAWFTL